MGAPEAVTSRRHRWSTVENGCHKIGDDVGVSTTGSDFGAQVDLRAVAFVIKNTHRVGVVVIDADGIDTIVVLIDVVFDSVVVLIGVVIDSVVV